MILLSMLNISPINLHNEENKTSCDFDALNLILFCYFYLIVLNSIFYKKKNMSFKGKWIFNDKNDKFEFREYEKALKHDEESKLRPLTVFIEVSPHSAIK